MVHSEGYGVILKIECSSGSSRNANYHREKQAATVCFKWIESVPEHRSDKPCPRLRSDRAGACWLGGMLVIKGATSIIKPVATGMVIIRAMAAA